MKNLKLKIQLIPQQFWGFNLREILGRNLWEVIRKDELKKAKGKCFYCASDEELHCHEYWIFDDKKLIQKLKKLQIVCRMCHHVIHIGATARIDYDGNLMKKVKEHFLRVNEVNECSNKEWNLHKEKAWSLFNRRVGITDNGTKKIQYIDFNGYASEVEIDKFYFKGRLKRFKEFCNSTNFFFAYKKFINEPEYRLLYKSEIIRALIQLSKKNPDLPEAIMDYMVDDEFFDEFFLKWEKVKPH